MRIDIHSTISLDGYIADINGSEDCFHDSNWESVLKLYKNYDAILWGRKTYEAVKGWGGNYLSTLGDVKIIVISGKDMDDRVIGIKDLNKLGELGLEKILICGGRTVYEYAIKNFEIKNFIFNINFFKLEAGIKFPEINRKLNLVKVNEKYKEFIQVKLQEEV